MYDFNIITAIVNHNTTWLEINNDKINRKV